ncbi:MAG: hypothetical protein KJ754_01060 [Bacteroidetes bacterium]|nr:hypothetical protein [Bacteroidota bacterium]MBU1577994.1 hypothetical protein [Bacteroidota bacterium]
MNKNSTLPSYFHQQSCSETSLEMGIRNSLAKEFDKMKPSKQKLKFILDFAAAFECFRSQSTGKIENMMN